MGRAKAPHADDLETTLVHFNAQFRRRYRLPAVTAARLRQDVPDLDALLTDLGTVRADGVVDASCAVVAQLALSITPMYAIGMLTASEHLTVFTPDEGDPESYVGGHVLLVNPLGGRNNWASISAWFRTYGAINARRTQLAGLASEKRRDEAANLKLLQDAAATHRRAIALPPDEAFSAERAAEVSYIYQVPVETLRSWKQRNRRDLAAKKPGRPPGNR